MNLYEVEIPVDSNVEFSIEASIICSMLEDYVVDDERNETIEFIKEIEYEDFAHKGLQIVFRAIKSFVQQHNQLPSQDIVLNRFTLIKNKKLVEALKNVFISVLEKTPLPIKVCKAYYTELEMLRVKKYIEKI